jgi:hypothetical protein
MSVDELLAQLVFSASGKDVRIAYTTAGTPVQTVIEYVGVTAAVNGPTDAEIWFITKLQYDSSACCIRARSLSVKKKWDDRASLFP